MNWDVRNILKLFISLGIGIGLVYFIQSGLSAEDRIQITKSLKHLNYFYVGIVVFLGALACIIRAHRWHQLLSPMGYNPRISSLTASIFIMYIANLIFPRLGEVLRCSIIQKEEHIPIEKSIGTMIVERLVDIVGLGVFALLGLIFEYDKFITIYNQYLVEKGESNHTFLYIILILIGIVGIILWRNNKFNTLIKEKIMGMLDGFKSIGKLENPFLFVLYSIAIYIIYFICTYIIYFSIDETSHLSLSSALVVLTAGTLGIGLTQGGIGAFQLLVSQSLELYQIPKPIALAYAWASWLVQTINLIFFGIVSWIYLLIRSGKEN